MDVFFNLSLFVLFIKTKHTFQNRTGLSIPVNLNASKRKEERSHCFLKWFTQKVKNREMKYVKNLIKTFEFSKTKKTFDFVSDAGRLLLVKLMM